MRRGHRTRHQINMARRAMPKAAEVKVLQNLQHGDQGCTAARRRVGTHGVTPVAALQRLVRFGFDVRYIIAGHVGTIRRKIGGDFVAQLAVMEFTPAATRKTFQCARVVRQPHDFADFKKAAIRMKVDAGALSGLLNARHAIGYAGLPVAHPHSGCMRRDHDAFFSLRNGRGDQIGPRQRAMLLVEKTETCRSGRRHDRGVANLAAVIVKQTVARYLGAALGILGPHIRTHFAARAVVKIHHAAAARIGAVIVQRAHAANAAHERIVDHLRKCRCDGGIKGIAAPGKNRSANIGGARLRTNDDALHSVDLPFHGYGEELTRAGADSKRPLLRIPCADRQT